MSNSNPTPRETTGPLAASDLQIWCDRVRRSVRAALPTAFAAALFVAVTTPAAQALELCVNACNPCLTHCSTPCLEIRSGFEVEITCGEMLPEPEEPTCFEAPLCDRCGAPGIPCGSTCFSTSVCGNTTCSGAACAGPTPSPNDPPGAIGDIEYYHGDPLGSTRLVTDGAGLVVSRHDYMPFGEEIPNGMFGRADGYEGDGTLRHRFTSKERDDESGLDYFGARYYSAGAGRFASADPLFVEIRRLSDPQLLHLYMYSRNNPLRYVDPSGLDVTCTGSYCSEYLDDLQKSVSFKLGYDHAGRIAVDGPVGKKLPKAEKELLKAIRDKKHHVTIDTVSHDPGVEFGRFDGGGRNTIDFGDTALLRGPLNAGGPFTPERVAGHETLEAYAASKKKTLDSAHGYANKHFPGLGAPIGSSAQLFGDPITGTAMRIEFDLPVHKSTERIRITREFVTPVPQNAIIEGHVPAHLTQVERRP